jgi:hypothetical protein
MRSGPQKICQELPEPSGEGKTGPVPLTNHSSNLFLRSTNNSLKALSCGTKPGQLYAGVLHP